jgi:hypothetical protein
MVQFSYSTHTIRQEYVTERGFVYLTSHFMTTLSKEQLFSLRLSKEANICCPVVFVNEPNEPAFKLKFI